MNDRRSEIQLSRSSASLITRGGIPCALISLPNRYMHSPVEVVSLKDLEQIPELMSAFALSLKKGQEFKVRI